MDQRQSGQPSFLVWSLNRGVRELQRGIDPCPTSGIYIGAPRRKIIEQEDNEEKNPSGLEISRTLTLSHPGDFYFLQGGCGAGICAFVVPGGFLVGVVRYVSRRQRD